MARSVLSIESMKTFLLLVLTVVALFVWQRNAGQSPPGSNRPPTAYENSASASPSPPGLAHHWIKNSLGRAEEVAKQVRTSRAENDLP